MFEWLRRRRGAAAPAQRARAQPKSAGPPPPRPGGRPPRFAESASLPEVVAEGNTQADWSVWEDSMSALDSQLQGIESPARVQVRETRPGGSGEPDPDPFAGVRHKRPR